MIRILLHETKQAERSRINISSSSLDSSAVNMAYVLCLAYPVLTFILGNCVISDSFFGNLLRSNSGCMKDTKNI